MPENARERPAGSAFEGLCTTAPMVRERASSGIGSETPSRVIEGHTDDVYCVQFHPQENRLLTLGYSGSVNLWDLGSGSPLFRANLPVV
ncbi:MAG: hypothetical protein HC767_11660, partial [Akkermansiaceae bacterium]|nr:hypothetical protein [Akkermansiaceae bacterium]